MFIIPPSLNHRLSKWLRSGMFDWTCEMHHSGGMSTCQEGTETNCETNPFPPSYISQKNLRLCWEGERGKILRVIEYLLGFYNPINYKAIVKEKPACPICSLHGLGLFCPGVSLSACEATWISTSLFPQIQIRYQGSSKKAIYIFKALSVVSATENQTPTPPRWL